VRTRVFGAALLGAAVLFLGSACGGKSDTGTAAGPAAADTGPAGTQTTAAKSTGLSCPSSATAGDKLDMTFPTDVDAEKQGDTLECTYRGKKKVTNTSEFVLLIVYDKLNAGYMDNFRQQNAEWKPVNQAGLGDDAFSFQTQSIGTTLNNLVIRKGDRIAQVGGNATIAQEASLLNLVLGA
jgi:hypothetical protein